MTDKEEFDLKMDLIWYKKRFENLEPNVKKYARMCIISVIMSFVYGVVVGALIF